MPWFQSVSLWLIELEISHSKGSDLEKSDLQTERRTVKAELLPMRAALEIQAQGKSSRHSRLGSFDRLGRVSKGRVMRYSR
jgi:hypothetical protein